LFLQRPDVAGDDSLRRAAPHDPARGVDLLDGRRDVEPGRLPAERRADGKRALGLGAVDIRLPDGHPGTSVWMYQMVWMGA
jgi:hypothetical protein